MQALRKEIETVPTLQSFGRVARSEGLLVEVTGAAGSVTLGGQLSLEGGQPKRIPRVVVGFRDGRALAMPLGNLNGITLGADFLDGVAAIYPSLAWLGRILNGFGQPMDGKGPLPKGPEPHTLRRAARIARTRTRIGSKLAPGIHGLNPFVSGCKGLRMGIFWGFGVGKSTLMAILARNSDTDAIVIGLVGEHGRELKEFIEDDLGTEGLARSVAIAATSDEPALVRRQSANVAMAVAEQLPDQGLHVLLVMDSMTRSAMAQREVGLSAGEPPTTKGYTPTMFAELPRLLERVGPGTEGSCGSITGLFTVLVEGNEPNDPISDAVRGILDGHIVLGAYKNGTHPEVDAAIALHPKLGGFLSQNKDEHVTLTEGYASLDTILGGKGRQQ